MPDLKTRYSQNLSKAFQKSEDILSRAVALPITALELEKDVTERIRKSVINSVL